MSALDVSLVGAELLKQECAKSRLENVTSAVKGSEHAFSISEMLMFLDQRAHVE
jgi:hypothetical protein